MPIYVSDDGADHRAHAQLFQTGAVAGVPFRIFPQETIHSNHNVASIPINDFKQGREANRSACSLSNFQAGARALQVRLIK